MYVDVDGRVGSETYPALGITHTGTLKYFCITKREISNIIYSSIFEILNLLAICVRDSNRKI
jgi:hypothetical protein